MIAAKIRNKTNGGDHCKQIFMVIDHEQGAFLVIHKWVLSSDEQLYCDYELLKRFKGRYLFFQSFLIRIQTLGMVGGFIEERLNEIQNYD